MSASGHIGKLSWSHEFSGHRCGRRPENTSGVGGPIRGCRHTWATWTTRPIAISARSAPPRPRQRHSVTSGSFTPALVSLQQGDQLAALVYRHPVLLDRTLDCGLLIRRVFDDADEFRGRALDVVDRPRIGFLFGCRSSLHHARAQHVRPRRMILTDIEPCGLVAFAPAPANAVYCCLQPFRPLEERALDDVILFPYFNVGCSIFVPLLLSQKLYISKN
jgi:hypothetical protein